MHATVDDVSVRMRPVRISCHWPSTAHKKLEKKKKKEKNEEKRKTDEIRVQFTVLNK